MKIRQITLNQDEIPAKVTVTMTLAEAVFINKVLGKMTGHDASAVMPNGDVIEHEIYTCLASGLFDRYWEDGIDGAEKDL